MMAKHCTHCGGVAEPAVSVFTMHCPLADGCLCNLLLSTQATILANLKDPDVSIRRRALDLLFTMCDGGAAVEVVEELVSGTSA